MEPCLNYCMAVVVGVNLPSYDENCFVEFVVMWERDLPVPVSWRWLPRRGGGRRGRVDRILCPMVCVRLDFRLRPHGSHHFVKRMAVLAKSKLSALS